MNKLTHFALMGALALAAAVSCKSDKPRQIAPAKGGERNESCFSKNDCGSNLSCINNRCTPTDFDLLVTGKECMIEDCTETADCCGEVPVEAPAKCNGYTAICET